jgi:hypothetical protein
MTVTTLRTAKEQIETARKTERRRCLDIIEDVNCLGRYVLTAAQAIDRIHHLISKGDTA